jgi:hypothetical protein
VLLGGVKQYEIGGDCFLVFDLDDVTNHNVCPWDLLKLFVEHDGRFPSVDLFVLDVAFLSEEMGT